MDSILADISTPYDPEDALQAISDLNLIMDADGGVVKYTSGHFFGDALPEGIAGSKLQDILSPGAMTKVRDAIAAVRASGQARAFEYNFSTPGNERWFDARLVPLAGEQFLLVARDVTRCRETEMRMRRQMDQLSMLRSVDLAIASGLDLNLLLAMVSDQVLDLMQIDAVAILLHNAKSNILEFNVGKGFRSNSLRYTHLRLGEGCAGRVALERKLLSVPDLRENQMAFGRSPLFRMEEFIAYFGVPLIAKGRVLGVLELFHRSPRNPDSEWVNFLNMVAGQVAIAIDNAMMFRELQRSNVELNVAYDATIEGITRALDLRDKETEEHTRRVSDLTIQMAVRFGVEEADLVHVRRGAVLHDIGKMAIPDRILFKPGPLDEEEWKIMRRHPGIAVDLLSSVSYLAPALDIPHWHHEKWDGSGYPDRLHGDEIPFAARLFALVDVYDALTSNRPYRGAWSKADTLHFIENQSGRHFDPAIVPEFVRYMDKHTL
jgi:HD-GYP domain-containing protein (c-di-GMP phosphodiesterase class II)